MHYITGFHRAIVGKKQDKSRRIVIFLLSLLTFLYKSRMFCEKIRRRRTMESCDQTHTSIADEYEERAEAVDVTMNHPYSSCYDGMLEQTELLGRARIHQEEARKIRKIFKDIARWWNVKKLCQEAKFSFQQISLC